VICNKRPSLALPWTLLYDGGVPASSVLLTELRTRLQAALVDRYTIEREIGRGGMATVFLAREVKHERPLAIKVLHPELASAIGVERFVREIRLAARLQHPHILPLHDSGEADGLLFYTMPYVDGESLRNRLAREKQLSLDATLRIAREVAEALSYAHSQDVVHRDIKPENILLSGGVAVVSDFGIARAITAAAGDKLTETGIAVGTPAYMSPEQAAGEQVDGRSDIYSLGCVVYEMLAGHPPFLGATPQEVLARHTLDPVPPLRTARATVPKPVEQAIETALAKAPADRFATAAEFVAALASRDLSAPTWKRAVRRAWPLGIAVVLAITAVLWSKWRPPPALDPDLVAVAPFTVLDRDYDLWREGLVDVLSASLDGAGPLRTVSPTVVVRRWSGHADAPSAIELGRRTGARFAVYGRLVAAGDSVRLTASLLDVASGKLRAEIEVRDLGARLDRVADSLAVALLRELGRSLPTGPQLPSLGTTSLRALKVFLQAEQFYRRTMLDSALVYGQRAVALDSGFAVAWRRLSYVSRWLGGDSVANIYARRAAALNHGLSPHDSLLIFADSLFLALDKPTGRFERAERVRLSRTLEGAAERYPTDPEVWFQLGDAGLHFPVLGRTTAERSFEALQRAIALDSAFGPPYIHAAELAISFGRRDDARRYLAAHLRLKPTATDAEAEGLRLAAALLASGGVLSPDLERQIDAVSTEVLAHALFVVGAWPDSVETALRLVRIAARKPPPRWLYESWGRRFLSSTLTYRGHMREAYAVATPLPGGIPPELPLLGGVPPESVAAIYARWLRMPIEFNAYTGLSPALYALPWWAANRDTMALRTFAWRNDSVARAATDVEARLWAHYGAASAAAYFALAEGDSAVALQRFTGLPDSVCLCVVDRITTAQLLAARKRHREAAALLDRLGRPWYSPIRGLWYLERARLAEHLGEREKAIEFYHFVVDVWRNADPELQAFVAEARAALTRLSAEPQ